MIFQNEFYEDEVREGFYVPSMMKKCWAAELEVLSEIDKICKKHNITYFAAWGTLLAAVRHGGFIPWDDDLDIIMKRDDYIRFMEVANEELPEGYEAYNYRNKEDYWLYITRVVGKNRICFEEEHLERFHQFPYMVGVDLFVLDYVSKDAAKEEQRDLLARHNIIKGDKIFDGEIAGLSVLDEIRTIENGCYQLCQMKYSDEFHACAKRIADGASCREDLIYIRRQMYLMAEKLFALFDEAESDYLTQLFPFGMQNKEFRYGKELFAKTIAFAYENITIPVPLFYDEVLSKNYGDYYKVVKTWNGHGYPFYNNQHKALMEKLDFELPSFTYDSALAKARTIDKTDKFKAAVNELLKELERVVNDRSISIEAKASDAQAVAIDLGNTIEAVFGEEHCCIHLLEEFCEVIYEASVKGMITGSVIESFEDVKAGIVGEILDKEMIVFLSFKASNWDAFAPIYQMKESKANAFVISVPYYGKKYDGSLWFEGAQDGEYPISISLANWDIDMLYFLNPDAIYIQNPYDGWNDVITIDKQYYIEMLRKCTEKIIYIPWFEISDFTKQSEREYFNMKNYVCVPGVMYADKVLLYSEQMKDTYVDKMCDFTGLPRKQFLDRIEIMPKQATCDSKDRKRIIVHLGMTGFANEGVDYIKKMEGMLENLFANNDIGVTWVQDNLFEKQLEEVFPESFKELRRVINRFVNEKDLVYLKMDEDCNILAKPRLYGDAYYGDVSRLLIACEYHDMAILKKG